MNSYAPIARIVLRYLVGGVLAGSPVLGKELASDPDLVNALTFLIAGAATAVGAGVELLYAHARKKGWTL